MDKKAVVFDFDGTLTKKDQNIWKMLWEECGYSTDKNSLYANLYVSHVIKKEITRNKWFNLTCKAFKEKGLNFFTLYNTSKRLQLIDGLEETLSILNKNGFSLFIVSGCIKEAIEISLGLNTIYFDYIESNRALFDPCGELLKLKPTDFDYAGKARFIEKIKQAGYKAENIYFVGNSDNDEWAYKTGCKTICINPDHKADANNSKVWHNKIEKLDNLTQILPLIISSEEEKTL